MTDIQTAAFNRKPLRVQAIRVSDENLESLAVWSGGKIGQKGQRRFIHLSFAKTGLPRHTVAYSGDWLTKVGKSFKVYTDDAFRKNFDRVNCVKHELEGCFECSTITYVENGKVIGVSKPSTTP